MRAPESFTFPSSDGKTEIAAVRWRPEGAPRAVLQVTHGMQEHILRYGEFAEYLAARGYLVVGHDHLGHGASAAADDDLGYFGPGPSELAVADIHALRRLTQEKVPGLPYFMMGHSMGSFMLRMYLARHGGGLAGAIIMGTGFTPESATRGGLVLIGLLEKLAGDRHRSAAVAKLAFGKAYRPYDMTGADPSRSWLSHDPARVEAYYADPRCGFPFTLNGYRALLEAVQFSCRQENVDAIPASLPVLLVSGEDDPVGNAGHGVRQVHRLMIIAGIRDLQLKLYPGCLHELLNETNRTQVMSDLAGWMDARIPAAR